LLSGFAQHGVTLTKIESRACLHPPGEYLFYIEFQGALDDPSVREAIDALRSHTTRVRVLGSFLPGELA
jgi:prephenate dehydratase